MSLAWKDLWVWPDVVLINKKADSYFNKLSQLQAYYANKALNWLLSNPIFWLMGELNHLKSEILHSQVFKLILSNLKK